MSSPSSNREKKRLSNDDLETIRAVLKQHPVRLGVLFGSVVSGKTHAHSDIDIAVEFEDSVPSIPTDEILSLITDLSSALERNDIDLSVVSDMKLRVGVAAFRDGVLLVGSQERMELHRTGFERALEHTEEKPLRERFDTVLENIAALKLDSTS